MGLTFIPLVYTFTLNHLEATDTKNNKLDQQLYEINQKQILLYQYIAFLLIITISQILGRGTTIQLL